MKEDFIAVKQQLPEICQVASDFYLTPKRRGANYFVKSPVSNDKTWSLCLYPANNRYCDFAGGNHSGDIISFISYVKGINNWEALQTLKDFYGLAGSREKNRQEIESRIELQQQEARRKEERRKTFYRALRGEIDRLKHWNDIYRATIEKGLYEAFTDEWCYCMAELQRIDYKLDVLCAADCKAYMRMKSNSDLGLSSDRFQWLLDVLEVLQENGAFTATKEEKEEITKQRNFELTRQPETGRRCGIDW